jgi:hypothetical protein
MARRAAGAPPPPGKSPAQAVAALIVGDAEEGDVRLEFPFVVSPLPVQLVISGVQLLV